MERKDALKILADLKKSPKRKITYEVESTKPRRLRT